MKISKSTYESCKENGYKVYAAKKVTSQHGEWITCIYAVILNENTVTTEKTVSFEGRTQQDIVSYFCNN